MDLFATLSSFVSVKQVSNLHHLDGKINFVFFICPQTKKGMVLNQLKTGFTARYIEGFSASTNDRLERINKFSEEARRAGINFSTKAIFAAADPLILFPLYVTPPNLPTIVNVDIISNFDVVRNRMDLLARLYDQEPWKYIPQKFVTSESVRLSQFLPSNAPENLKKDFVRRIFAGFALDGITIKEGLFGNNPVILGIESQGVTVLQNSALQKSNWLPVIDLN